MGDPDSAHCRFCAKHKPYGKLFDLQTDDDRRRIVMEKLRRLSLVVANLNSPHDALPKTVCFPCMEALDQAFQFVLSVEASQTELGVFGVITVKQEVLDEDISHPQEDKHSEQPVKVEVEISGAAVIEKSELESTKETQKDNSDNKKKLKKKSKNIFLVKTSLVDSQTSWKDYSWLCAYCDVMFSCIDELKEHSMQTHGCCNAYRCTDCKMRKLNLDSFVKHVKRHRNNLKLSCYKCHKIFHRQYDAIMHKKEHIATEFKCPGCEETFGTKEQSLEHISTYNRDRKIRELPPEQLTNDLSCVFCHKQFSYKGGLTTHILTQHREKKRDYTCDKCGKCFLNKANLAGHILMHDDIRPYECEICKHCFRRQSQLNRHMGIHDGKRPFACEQCGRCFRLKKQLSTHRVVHTDNFPFICSCCQKGFKHKSTFIQHKRQHTGERPYKCHVCEREFTNWPNYNKHMKRLHGMNMAKSQQAPEGHPTSAGLEIEITKNLTSPDKNDFKPKRRGRPKSINNKKLHDEIKIVD